MVTPEEKRALLDPNTPDDAPDSTYTQDEEIHDDDKRHERFAGVSGDDMSIQVGSRFVPWGEFWARVGVL